MKKDYQKELEETEQLLKNNYNPSLELKKIELALAIKNQEIQNILNNQEDIFPFQDENDNWEKSLQEQISLINNNGE